MKIAPLLMLPLMIGQSYAFDAWGFRSGMSEEQTAAVARRDGYKARRSTTDTARFHSLWFFRRGANGTDEIGYGASFCDGRLTWVSHDYKANIGTLFELLSELKSSYGAPTVETSSEVRAEGRVRSIDFNFRPRPDDVTEVAAVLSPNTDTAFGIQVIHHNTEMGCE
ncbi:MAG TPA: hypothetical protein VMT66_00365 [Steroidobacteraceae bacterium]|nr:hypothetical protein [Steroidobacteraceae bacterium]